MKIVFNVIFLSFFLSISELAFACTTVLIAGAQGFKNNSKDSAEDIAVSLFNESKKLLEQSKCKIVIIDDTNKEKFIEKIKAIASETKKNNDSVQFLFTDHGSPSRTSTLDPISDIVIGSENPAGRIKNIEFVDLLKKNFLDNQRITFASSICWPQFSELIIESGLDSKFDICGGSSVHIDDHSRNYPKIRTVNGMTVGSYTSSGLYHSNQAKHKLSVFKFHDKSRSTDGANFLDRPGFITSMTYARMILQKNNIYPAIEDKVIKYEDTGDMEEVDNSLTSLLNSFPLLEESMIKNRLTATFNNTDCIICTERKFLPMEQLIKNVHALLIDVEKIKQENLPSLYREKLSSSVKWLKKDNSSLAKKLREIAVKRRDFLIKNKERILKSKEDAFLYVKVQNEWKKLNEELYIKLLPLAYHLRNLQQAKTISDFMSVATKDERNRFQKILDCESRPMF